jgi:hypothetical protein
VDNPARDGRTIDVDSSLRHHLIEIAIALAISWIPAPAEHDDLFRKMPSLKDRRPPGLHPLTLPDSRRTELRHYRCPKRLDNEDLSCNGGGWVYSFSGPGFKMANLVETLEHTRTLEPEGASGFHTRNSLIINDTITTRS